MKVKVKSKKGSVKLFLRNALIRHAKVFGSRIPTLLDKISYLIKCSQFFSVKTKLFSYRKDMYRHIIEQYKLSRKDINYLEYGVYAGGTIRWWSEKNGSKNSTFIGFDSFEGLPETWGGNFEKGTYDTGGQIPDINDERVIFKAGWFNDTLPKFIKTHTNLLSKEKIIHIDCDLYSSTLYVLVKLGPFLKKGDILIFDEFFGFRFPHTEFRAFLDFCAISKLNYEVIGKTYSQISFIIK